MKKKKEKVFVISLRKDVMWYYEMICDLREVGYDLDVSNIDEAEYVAIDVVEAIGHILMKNAKIKYLIPVVIDSKMIWYKMNIEVDRIESDTDILNKENVCLN